MLAESPLYDSLERNAFSTTGEAMCIYGVPAVIECPINNSYFFYANCFCLSIFFCRVRYYVIFIVAVGTLLFVIKLMR